jgi:molecular chaperone DnaJ
MTGDQQDQYSQYYGGQGMGGMGGFGGAGPFGFGGGAGGAGFENDGRFKDFWENIDEIFGGQGPKQEKNKKGRDVIVNLEISFMEAIQGCQKQVVFDRVSVCSTCNGTKCKPGSSPSTCSTCGGSGQVMYKQGYMSIAMVCNSCNGEGSMIRNPCMTCYGKGYTNMNVKESINIPKGVDDNMNLRLQKKVFIKIFINLKFL